MSLVVFPFRDEPASLVSANIAAALAHERVDEVWAIAGPDGPSKEMIAKAQEITGSFAKPIRLLPQQRLGTMRPGKGDAMNTAISLAASQNRDRVHFYDADITNFDAGWIEGAEHAADRGYGVVRHRFPRAATDAMITWFITRPSLALIFPDSILPRLGQPLGGEFLITGSALTALAESNDVIARSDWGIDTMITYDTAVLDVGLYEHHVDDGKRHALYGSLAELRTMALECLDAVGSLQRGRRPPADARHGTDEAGPVPADLKETVAYDPAATALLIEEPLSPMALAISEDLPVPLELAGENVTSWGATLEHLLDGFDLKDAAWRELAFHLWVRRVLAYTRDVVPSGYDASIRYLERTIDTYVDFSSR